MNLQNKKVMLIASALPLVAAFLYAFTITKNNLNEEERQHLHCTPERHVCVMKTIFELETPVVPVKADLQPVLPDAVKRSIASALNWIEKAQLPDGGWGAGFHARQHIRDPHAVAADPATTSLVLLSLLRTGNTLDSGVYRDEVKRATVFLLTAVEHWSPNQPRLTQLHGTQPQQKLGQNIDVILTAQYLTTLLKHHSQHPMKRRIQEALQKCVTRIEKEQDHDGNWRGGGWAPVLQSALADQALEEAQELGINVDAEVLMKSKAYQKSNFDTATKSAITGKAAGVLFTPYPAPRVAAQKKRRKLRRLSKKQKSRASWTKTRSSTK